MKPNTARLADPVWRLRNLYQIVDESGAIIPFKLRGEQERFLRERHHRTFVPKARKLGLSTVIVLLNLDHCIFNPTQRVGIIDLTRIDAEAKLQMARIAWDRGPFHPDAAIAELWRLIHMANPLTREGTGSLTWKNKSTYTAGTSFTGSTPQILHISEYGPISAQQPQKAQRMKRGSINAVPPEGYIYIETTLEGQRYGPCYQLFQQALANSGKEKLAPTDWKMLFFSWLEHPSYRLFGHTPKKVETQQYFSRMEREHGLKVDPGKQAWYEAKKAEQGEDIYSQFPTILEECDRAVVSGQILPGMKTVRAEGRVSSFTQERGQPLFTAWDLGSSDNSAGWLIQPAGKETNWLSWSAGEGLGAGGVAEVMRAWEREHGPIHHHFLPHDAEITDKGAGKTYLAQLVECGIPRDRISIVPRTPDIWVAIDQLRQILPNSWFHSRCDEEIPDPDGGSLPSGVQRLEGYRKKEDRSTGWLRDVPVHDICSHTADAARTWAQAVHGGLVAAATQHTTRRAVDVQRGFRGR